MATTIIHIADFVGDKRVKTCNGMTLTPPEPDDKNIKVLCEDCRKTVLNRRK